MDQILKHLKCFVKDKKSVHLLCGCEEDVIHAIAQLIYNFLKQKLKIKRPKIVRKKLYPIRFQLRQLSDKRVSTRTKRKILINKEVRSILHPIIKNILVPTLLKSMK